MRANVLPMSAEARITRWELFLSLTVCPTSYKERAKKPSQLLLQASLDSLKKVFGKFRNQCETQPRNGLNLSVSFADFN
jgi:hypothetical protein